MKIQLAIDNEGEVFDMLVGCFMQVKTWRGVVDAFSLSKHPLLAPILSRPHANVHSSKIWRLVQLILYRQIVADEYVDFSRQLRQHESMSKRARKDGEAVGGSSERFGE